MYRHIASPQGGTVTKHVLTDHDDDWCFGARPTSAGYMTPVSQLPVLKQEEKERSVWRCAGGLQPVLFGALNQGVTLWCALSQPPGRAAAAAGLARLTTKGQ